MNSKFAAGFLFLIFYSLFFIPSSAAQEIKIPLQNQLNRKRIASRDKRD